MDWYPDPADPTRERYWDGQQWTHNTRAPRNLPAPTPQPQASRGGGATQAPGPFPSGQQYPPQQPGQPDPWAPQPYAQYPQNQEYPQYPQSQQYPQQQFQPYPQHPQAQWAQSVGPATPDGVPLAGWWSRVVAHMLDQIMISLVLGLLVGEWSRRFSAAYAEFVTDYLNAVQNGTAIPSIGDYDLMGPASVVWAVQTALTVAYLTAMYALRGATVGQMALGLRVTPEDRGAAAKGLGWGRALVRALVLTACLMTSIPFLLSALMPLWTRRRQTLHDMAAHTVVVRERR